MRYDYIQSIIVMFILVSIFFILNSYSQNCAYAEYYHLTDLARKNYTSKNYKEAKEQFQLAFSKTDFPHGQDLNFALFTSIELKDNTWARLIAEKLARGGIPLRYFMRYKKKKWFADFEKEFEDYTSYYDKNFNLELQQNLKMLLKEDIEINNKHHKWRTREIDMTLTELITEASEIFSEFQQIMNKYGFPNERLMGYNYLRRKNSVEPYKIEILMIHIYGRGEYILKNKITDIVCDGGLPPYYEKMLKTLYVGDSPGIEEAMKAKYLRFRGKE